ncbi:hypothetical protein L1987_76412 [Smallanthus sonchifolius]|uniref:Uncharacterized protein n=1 Tax=Smallanthus sonchifolius TaxID=185202 RepID=A0ACB9A7H0_9ASTR|nr:hypothetical protein L1987_76412 [Smallanthus sonchifolius]
MEERGPPSSSIHVGDHHNPATNNLQTAHLGTYVVQVPKDQICRTPPPENALIAERHRNATNKKPFSGPLRCVLISIIILVLLSGIILGIILGVIKKDDPRFRVERVHVTTKGKTRQQKQEFGITLVSKNPNAHTIIIFDDHGKAYLSFKDRKFVKGRFPSSKQDPKNLKDIKLTFTCSSKRKLPLEIRKSMNGTNVKSQKHVEILLEFRVPVTMKIGALQMKSKTLSMLCHFKVNNLAKNSRVISQDCDYSTRL